MWRCVFALALAACSSVPRLAPDGGGDDDAPRPPDASPPRHVTITATVNSTRFVTREHMLAGGEMQISGEPLAEAMGRRLPNFSRDRIPTDLYFDSQFNLSWIDLTGFSAAIESYEYSKQPMNSLAFESSAGTSLAFAPLVNPSHVTGSAASALLADTIQHYATNSHALGRFVFPAGTFPTANSSGDTNPTGAGTGAENPLGWPGIWPTAHVFASFDPAIDPTGDIALGCAISSDDDPDGMIGYSITSADYECDATTLHLRDRASQIDSTITPGADGFSGWKYGLWVLNYLQVMHDPHEAPVVSVAAADLAGVGSLGNQIYGYDANGFSTAAGTYLGSSDIEGFQAQMFIAMLDNRAADWLGTLSTADGATLNGFASIAAALHYDYVAPLRWFPHAVAVTETPQPVYSLASADSEALDLVGLVLGYSEMYALTDAANADVGGSQPARAFFDGDPFPADNQLADGEATLHDRALAMLRVALIDLDRMHTDPSTGVIVDNVASTGTTAQRGHTLSTTTAAYALIGFRTALRSLGGQLELYSNNTPDTARSRAPLDGLAIAYPGNAALTFSARVAQQTRAHAELLYTHLTDATGRAWRGWDVTTDAPVDDTDTLDAHAAAIRGLFAAYLATGDVRYRTRAIAVFDRMDAVFYDRDARIYSATPAPVDDVEYTPLRFALVQSTLRDMYELVATRPGGEARVPALEDRLARLDKLVLDGWDDRDANRLIDWPAECVDVVDGLPRGGLQMAERTLTGEIGSLQAPLLPGDTRIATSDREHDCVPEIDDAHLPAALADSITFHLARE
ncbi:MAG: hypothetical protein ABJE66_03305 [Deltaproteobacteria bacterium]